MPDPEGPIPLPIPPNTPGVVLYGVVPEVVVPEVVDGVPVVVDGVPPVVVDGVPVEGVVPMVGVVVLVPVPVPAVLIRSRNHQSFTCKSTIYNSCNCNYTFLQFYLNEFVMAKVWFHMEQV